MRSRIDVQRLTRLSLLTAMALAAQWLESFLPPLIPGIPVRIGLANCFVLYALLAAKRRGMFDALIVTVLRSFLFMLIVSNPAQLLYSLAGGILSVLAMAGLLPLYRRERVSPIGTSVVGAFCFNIGQLFIGCLAAGWAMIAYLPWMGLLSILAGAMTGLLVLLLQKRLTASAQA